MNLLELLASGEVTASVPAATTPATAVPLVSPAPEPPPRPLPHPCKQCGDISFYSFVPNDRPKYCYNCHPPSKSQRVIYWTLVEVDGELRVIRSSDLKLLSADPMSPSVDWEGWWRVNGWSLDGNPPSYSRNLASVMPVGDSRPAVAPKSTPAKPAKSSKRAKSAGGRSLFDESL